MWIEIGYGCALFLRLWKLARLKLGAVAVIIPAFLVEAASTIH